MKQVPGFEDKMVENLRHAGLTLGESGNGGRGGIDVNTAVIDARNRLGGLKSGMRSSGPFSP